MLSPEEINACANTLAGTLPALHAGQLRALGFRVAENIPDCAALEDGRFVPEYSTIDPDGTIRIRIVLKDARFSWVDVSWRCTPQ